MPQLTIQQAYDVAVRHHQAGQLPQAEQICRQILAQQPAHSEALHLLGLIAHQSGRADLAVDLIRRAIAVKPNYPEALNNLGVILSEQGQHDAAIAAYRQIIALNPNFPDVHNNLGTALQDQGLLDEAVAAYRQALALKPDSPDAHFNLGVALRDRWQLDAAIAAYRQAITCKFNFPEAHHHLGLALKDQALLDESIAAFRHATALAPENAGIHGNLIYALHYHPACDTQAMAAELRRWNERHAAPLARFIQPHANDRSPERRLRIGYVSPDFRDHVVGWNIMPLFQHLDHEHFETYCYANVKAPDHLTEEFRRHSEVFRIVSGLADHALTEQIRADGIDILVDLALHTPGNRLPVFARKPAPVQVTFAGYPSSTGLSTIDYRLTDPYLDPPEPGVDAMYVEKSLRLPATFWCYDPLENAALTVGPLPALANGYVTFGCLNNFCKVNDGVLKLWAQVMAGVPESRLLLLADEGAHRQRTLQLLAAQGIAPQRVSFFGKRPRPEYLKLYQQIDLGLDTLPYNGHTTSLDSYFMGVPVVTLVGRTVVGRAGLSQLTNLGMPELIARTDAEFVAIARGLARDVSRLAQLRATLRARMQASPLMDGAAFARNIEAAYRQMWRQWCAEASALR